MRLSYFFLLLLSLTVFLTFFLSLLLSPTASFYSPTLSSFRSLHLFLLSHSLFLSLIAPLTLNLQPTSTTRSPDRDGLLGAERRERVGVRAAGVAGREQLRGDVRRRREQHALEALGARADAQLEPAGRAPHRADARAEPHVAAARQARHDVARAVGRALHAAPAHERARKVVAEHRRGVFCAHAATAIQKKEKPKTIKEAIQSKIK